MADTDIVEDDLMRDPEPNDFTPAAIARKLARAEKVLRRVNGRLVNIVARFGGPPEPEKPALVAALQSVRAQTDEILKQVAAMETALRTS